MRSPTPEQNSWADTRSFGARVDARNGVATISLTGEFDAAAIPTLVHHLMDFETSGVAAIIIDLRDVRLMDPVVVDSFLAARDRAEANEHRLVFIGADPTARMLFEATGANSLLDDPDAAAVIRRFTGEGTHLLDDLPVTSADLDG